ncbi:MAG: hypothetical protein M3440_00275 [Chloroflexota bacterium]|nr:hypothetical protein [Chloroflexota bacterium]
MDCRRSCEFWADAFSSGDQQLAERAPNTGRGAWSGTLALVDLASQRERALDLFGTRSNDLGMGIESLVHFRVLQFPGLDLKP